VLLLVDLDGVVYRQTETVPGVPSVLTARAAAGDDVVYVTNNATAYHTDYQPRLAAHGAPIGPDRVITSARASAQWIREQMPAVTRVLAVGASGLDRELREAGFDVVTVGGWAAAGHPDAVVVGLDPQMSYLRIAAAADCVRAGAAFIATNRDPMFPTETGFRPGAGAVVAAVATASRTEPRVVIGKPGPYLLEVGARSVGADLHTAVMIGDSMSDIAAGKAVGARTVLILTGVTTKAMADALADDQRPTRIAADAAELEVALRELAAAI